MKIREIERIDSLGLFSSFEWKKSLMKKDGAVEFLFLNVIYGRNYSGKTTLSRMFRYFETAYLSSYYENPSFSFLLEDGTRIDMSSGYAGSSPMRVFNEDFCMENLSFLSDYSPSAKIASFAVLGTDNNVAEENISTLKSELGSSELNKESGKYLLRRQALDIYNDELQKNKKLKKDVEDLLQRKATKDKDSIKGKYAIFGDINYNVTKLKNDIERVSRDSYSPLSEDEEKRCLAIIQDTPKNKINKVDSVRGKFEQFVRSVNECINEEIITKQQIEEFLNIDVESWARIGKKLHEHKHEKCLFCGNVMLQSRWDSILNYFDEKSENLILKIEKLKEEILSHLKLVESLLLDKSYSFYSNYHEILKDVITLYNECFVNYSNQCIQMIHALEEKREHMSKKESLNVDLKIAQQMDIIIDKYNKIIEQNNKDTDKKINGKTDAQLSLLLNEVYKFINLFDYHRRIQDIERSSSDLEKARLNMEEIEKEISKILNEIDEWKASMVDESRGVGYINQYLEQLKGCSLRLEVVKENDGKSVYFQVVRNEGVAKNLSEGERKIIAFCYFIAKLKDAKTNSLKPIVWIDDPICSLDANHIFFVYGLIRQELVAENNVEQLFVSTHNLEFLKYMKRLMKQSKMEKQSTWLMLERAKESTSIREMPNYMKNHVTEFEYLFEQICQCAARPVLDETYPAFYNFGNNARKFLEIYLYYKNPEKGSCVETMSEMFGTTLAALYVDRINNEMSHLAGGLERGGELVEFPEIRSAAIQILTSIKAQDSKQYEALLKSVGVQDPLSLSV